MAATAPKGGEIVWRRLFEDLQQFSKELPGSKASAELNLEIVIGIMLQLLRAIGEGRLRSLDREAIINAILRAIGLNAGQAKSVLARLSASPDRRGTRCAKVIEITTPNCRNRRDLTRTSPPSGDEIGYLAEIGFTVVGQYPCRDPITPLEAVRPACL